MNYTIGKMNHLREAEKSLAGEDGLNTRLMEETFDCPVCQAHFQGKIVDSVSHQGQDSDFFPHYVGENPLPFFLLQCPQCNYCAYPDDFSKESQAKALKTTSKAIREILDQPLIKKLPVDARRYYLAGKLYEEQKRNPYHIANLYLRGSWCCRKDGDRRAEIELQQLGVRFFRAAVEHSTLENPDNLPVVTYLIGELYRRLEDKSAAREWFGSVEEVIFDGEQQWLMELTKKQAELNEHFIN